MATFLELCKKVRLESGLSGHDQPSTVKSQKGMMQRIVNWVNQACLDIQTLRSDWVFMYSEHSANLTIGQYEYSALALNAHNASRINDILVDGRDLTRIEYLNSKQVVSNLTQLSGSPAYFSVKPNGNILILPAPDSAINITISQYSKPISMTENTDIPILPTQFHDIIVYKALCSYASFDEASDLRVRHEMNYAGMLDEMIRSEIPSCGFSGSARII